MSDVSQGPGWWQASDGKWYPPELHPDAQGQPPGLPPYPGAGPGQPPGLPPYPGAGPGQPPGYYPQGAYPYGDGVPMNRRFNGMAIASLVCAIITIAGLGSLLGIIFGLVARRQIRASGGTQRGSALALGIIAMIFGHYHTPKSLMGSIGFELVRIWFPHQYLLTVLATVSGQESHTRPRFRLP